MDFFIVIGAGLLGALFMASQNVAVRVSFLRKMVLGCGGGAVAYAVLSMLAGTPTEASIGGFIMLFVVGGLAGGVAVLLYFAVVRFLARR